MKQMYKGRANARIVVHLPSMLSRAADIHHNTQCRFTKTQIATHSLLLSYGQTSLKLPIYALASMLREHVLFELRLWLELRA